MILHFAFDIITNLPFVLKIYSLYTFCKLVTLFFPRIKLDSNNHEFVETHQFLYSSQMFLGNREFFQSINSGRHHEMQPGCIATECGYVNCFLLLKQNILNIISLMCNKLLWTAAFGLRVSETLLQMTEKQGLAFN